MEENKDPAEIAMEAFIEKRKAKEEGEVKRITEMLQKGGLLMDYFEWRKELTEEKIKEITGMSEEEINKGGDGKLKIYYAKNIINGE